MLFLERRKTCAEDYKYVSCVGIMRWKSKWIACFVNSCQQLASITFTYIILMIAFKSSDKSAVNIFQVKIICQCVFKTRIANIF